MQQVLNIITKWSEEEELNIGTSISTIVVFTNRNKLHGIKLLTSKIRRCNYRRSLYIEESTRSQTVLEPISRPYKNEDRVPLLLARCAYGKTVIHNGS